MADLVLLGIFILCAVIGYIVVKRSGGFWNKCCSKNQKYGTMNAKEMYAKAMGRVGRRQARTRGSAFGRPLPGGGGQGEAIALRGRAMPSRRGVRGQSEV